MKVDPQELLVHMKIFQKTLQPQFEKTQKSSQKRKLLINSSDKEEQKKVLLLRSIKEKMETRTKKKDMDGEDRFVASISDERRELPRKRLLTKNEMSILFLYQMHVLVKESNSNNNNNTNNPFSLLQQGHQMVHLPGAFDITPSRSPRSLPFQLLLSRYQMFSNYLGCYAFLYNCSSDF